MFSFQTTMFALLALQSTAHQFIVFSNKINAFTEMI